MAPHTSRHESMLEALLRRRRGVIAAYIRERLESAAEPGEVRLATGADECGPESEIGRLGDAELAALGHEFAELRDIDAALKRLAAGTYGICIRCGGKISLRRLEAYPAADLCLDCKTAFEKRRGIVANKA